MKGFSCDMGFKNVETSIFSFERNPFVSAMLTKNIDQKKITAFVGALSIGGMYIIGD